MDKNKLIEKINKVKILSRDYKLIYEVLDELGIAYKKTTCSKCRRDLLNIAKEELGLIEDAASESDFNTLNNNDLNEYEYIYTHNMPLKWEGKIIKKNSPKNVIQSFCEANPSYCMKQIKINFNNK